jgi:hypothetical protein
MPDRFELQGHCPGLFHGYVPLPIPISCDVIHFMLGFVSGSVRTRGLQGALLGGFVLYQAIEELPIGDVKSFVKDVVVYMMGVLTQKVFTRCISNTIG